MYPIKYSLTCLIHCSHWFFKNLWTKPFISLSHKTYHFHFFSDDNRVHVTSALKDTRHKAFYKITLTSSNDKVAWNFVFFCAKMLLPFFILYFCISLYFGFLYFFIICICIFCILWQAHCANMLLPFLWSDEKVLQDALLMLLLLNKKGTPEE